MRENSCFARWAWQEQQQTACPSGQTGTRQQLRTVTVTDYARANRQDSRVETAWQTLTNNCRAQCGPFDERCRCEAGGGNWERNSDGGSCSGGGGAFQTASNDRGGGEYGGSIDTDGDGITDTHGDSGGYGHSPDRPGSHASPGTSYGGGPGTNRS